MRVLNLSSNDYANCAHNNARALRSIGVDCDDYVLNQHPFGYESQSEPINRAFIPVIVNSYDVVQIFHTCPIILDWVLRGKPNKIAVHHTGSRYREEPEYFNNLFNPLVDITFSDHCEFMELGGKNIHYLAPHVELEKVYRNNSKLVVGHYPSNPEVKGTNEIVLMLERFKPFYDIRIDDTKVNHLENLNRVAECNIYVELFKPELNGKRYGHYGVSAFEATALGCKVVTQNFYPKVYEDAYGIETPFILANTEEDFIKYFDDAKYWHESVFETKNDFYEVHSIEATGRRIKKLLE